jgi:putative tricarboxylic transport membrane protein
MRPLAGAAPFAILLCVAAYLFAQTLAFDFPRAPGRLGPDAWPQAILVLLMLACALGIAARVLAARSAEPPQARAARPELSADLEGDEAGGPSRYGLVAAGILLFAVYPLALEYTGFLVATFLLMALLMVAGQWRNPVGVLAVSALGTLVLFYVFRGVVYISLPLGRPPFQAWTIWVAALLGMR